MSTKVKQLLSNGGFNFTKFPSNNHDILKSLSSTNTVKSTDINLDLDEMPMERALEVLWQPEKDTLKSVKKKLPATKREILSFITTIFDPLDFVALAVLEPKLIMQELWNRNIEFYVFADASSVAYGAVSFSRIMTKDDIRCKFVLGKSR